MDLDADGRLDIISGSWPGELYLFRGLPDRTFAAGAPIKDREEEVLSIGRASAVHAADWDGDGKLDLLVGNIEGEVFLIPNEGSRQRYAFGKPTKLEADGKPIVVPDGDAGPVAADWDGDGKLDLLVGTGAGSVLWYRNIGTVSAPKLAVAQVLVPEGGPGQRGPWGARAKICVTDWNGDGRLDLIIGDLGGTFAIQPAQTDAERAALEQARSELPKLLNEWSKHLEQIRELQNAEAGTADEQNERKERTESLLETLRDLKEEIRCIQETLRKFQPRQESHGWVWLFLRKNAD